jgi:hypothetical protein
VGTTGPVTAALNGLDGQPTQEVPLFRLPGTTTGALLLNTTLTTTGAGTVTVKVTSLSDVAVTAEALATVRTAVPVSLDPFLCYRTRSTKGDLCAAESPVNAGGSCEVEEDCGGQSEGENDDTEETDFCAPNKFPRGLELSLADPFEDGVFALRKPVTLCNPAEVEGALLDDPTTHLRGFQIKLTKGQCSVEAPQNVGGGCRKEEECGGVSRQTDFCVAQLKFQKQKDLVITNIFHPQTGELHVDLRKPDRLVLPASKSHTEPLPPPDPATHIVDPYKCYRVKVTPRTPKFPKDLRARVVDQFDQEKLYDLKRPTRLCTPVELDGDAVKDETQNLMCYRVKATPKLCAVEAPANAGGVCKKEEDCGGVRRQTSFCQAQPKHARVKEIFISTELLPEQVDTLREEELCVPSGVSAAP